MRRARQGAALARKRPGCAAVESGVPTSGRRPSPLRGGAPALARAAGRASRAPGTLSPEKLTLAEAADLLRSVHGPWAEYLACVTDQLGAKARCDANVIISAPDSPLEQLAADRASVRFRDMADVEAKRAAFADVIRQWIRHV
jgi:hypothetical protein